MASPPQFLFNVLRQSQKNITTCKAGGFLDVLNGSAIRGWYARKSKPDYGIILDAATDAYISQKQIHFMVTNIKEGGTIEKFRFGIFEIKPPVHIAADLNKTVAELPKAESVTRLPENVPVEKETPIEPDEQVTFEPVNEPVAETKISN